jgi:hypothetical protein
MLRLILTRERRSLSILLVCIGFSLTAAPPQLAQNYSLPGGIRVLDEGKASDSGKLYDFPDNIESRKWLFGFQRGLTMDCPPDQETRNKISVEETKITSNNIREVVTGAEPLSSLFAGGLIASVRDYSLSLNHTYYPEGETDGHLLAKATNCNVGRVEYSTGMVILHSGRQPEPNDLPKFLTMASPEFRKSLGYDEAKADLIIHRDAVVPFDPTQSRIVPIYGGAVGNFFGRDTTAYQRTAAFHDLAMLRSRGQKIANCSYQGYQYHFWYYSVPADYEQIVSGVENHPFRALGRVSVNGCPANLEIARQLRQSIEKNTPVHFTDGVAVVDSSPGQVPTRP